MLIYEHFPSIKLPRGLRTFMISSARSVSVPSQGILAGFKINNPGVYQITATYSGDAANLTSTSAPLIQVLTGTFPIVIQGTTGGDAHHLQASLGVQ
jgi:hypothetical protein